MQADSEPSAATVLARLTPSAPRRIVGAGMLVVLGLFLISIALGDASGKPVVFGLLALVAGGAIWLAVRLWQSTARGLELTAQDLRDADGRVLARVADMDSVQRGVFALKPASGFTVVLRQSAGWGWAPGLWWKAGNRMGVGGVTHRNEARYMAEVLDDLIAKRRA